MMCCMTITADTTIRKSTPLRPSDVERLARVRASPAALAQLAELSGTPVSASSSEAAVLHALVALGLRAVDERTQDVGYARLAADYDAAEQRASARRRRPAWADE
jgi:hypothetical protein